MAKTDMVDERESGKGGAGGSVDNGPAQSGSGQGAGGVTRLRSANGGQFRTALSDNPGSAPYGGATDGSTTNQNARSDAALEDEKSNNGGGSATSVNADVTDYYKDLSARQEPNYDKLPNLQVKQQGLSLPPVEGERGFVGGSVGATPGFSVIQGKKGFTKDQAVWDQVSSFQSYKDNAGSVDIDDSRDLPHEEYDRDEFADWKRTVSKSDNMMPQTSFTRDTNDGVPGAGVDARDLGGGNPDTQRIPGQSSGDTDTPEMPQTEFTHGEDGYGGAPDFAKASPQNKEDASNLYDPQPVQ